MFVIGISVPKLSALKTYDNTSILWASGSKSWILSPRPLLITRKRKKQESFSNYFVLEYSPGVECLMVQGRSFSNRSNRQAPW